MRSTKTGERSTLCTVGSVFERESSAAQEQQRLLVFKQCDLAAPTHFLEPELREGEGGLRYVMFEREGADGPWAGCNSAGLLVVAADAYLDAEENPPYEPEASPLPAYAHLLAHCRSAHEAAAYMRGIYEALGAPDMILVADRTRAVLLECSPTHGVRELEGDAGWLASTNHFRLLPGAVTPEEDPSTYRRLERAEELLEAEPNLGGVAALLHDQADGETERSLCRVAEEEGQYFTQASVVFSAGEDGSIDCLYLLNGSPRTKAFTHWRDVFGVSERRSDARLEALDEPDDRDD